MTTHKHGYVIFSAGKGFIVYNTNKEFRIGHTHIRNRNSALAAIDFVEKKKIPQKSSAYYLKSLQRLSTDKTYIRQIEKRLLQMTEEAMKAGAQ